MIAIGLWIIRILIVMLIVRFITSALTGRRVPARGPRPQARSRQPQERLGGTLVQDPQCGTYIPQERAVTSGRGAAAVHFCSAACRDAWLAAHP